MRGHQRTLARVLGALGLITSGCLERQLEPLSPCLTERSSRTIVTPAIPKVDLLFVVDNSDSMANKQLALRMQLPNLIRVLTSGHRTPDDPDPFPAIQDLHVGVVSSDMGVPGVDFPNGLCRANGGDDGRLQHTGRGADCQADYPSSLSYVGDSSLGALSDPAQFAHDVSCVSDLGTGGCGFEQQLEAPFKALWPKLQLDASGNVVTPNEYRFIATTEPGTWGRGDQPAAEGGSLGFLRSDSLIAIVVVTDEDDCSVRSTEHLKPNAQLAPDSPYRSEDINLRCYHHKEFLYDLRQRYYEGFRRLRPGAEGRVLFAAVVGVPVDLVSADVLGKVDFSSDDSRPRDAFYDAILNDPRMQEQIDPATLPGSGTGQLQPSCSRKVSYQAEQVTAYPPRRIVELAKLFGKTGMLQSICQDDFAPAVDALIELIARNVGRPCLPRRLSRQADGEVACNVVWELPVQARSGSVTPTTCDALPFLAPVDEGRTSMNAAGGHNCKLRQLPVLDPSATEDPPGDGWYYDDFSAALQRECRAVGSRQAIRFTRGATPPQDVQIKLECLSETQSVPSTRRDLNQAVPQPVIGTACDGGGRWGAPVGDDACVITLANNMQLHELFCHAEQKTCVQRCERDSDCLPGWRCDERPESVARGGGQHAYCANPVCGF